MSDKQEKEESKTTSRKAQREDFEKTGLSEEALEKARSAFFQSVKSGTMKIARRVGGEAVAHLASEEGEPLRRLFEEFDKQTLGLLSKGVEAIAEQIAKKPKKV
jgi:hypothetical protein